MNTSQIIGTGVGLLMAFVLVIAATSIADDYDQSQEFTIDSESEWNTYTGTLTNVEVTADGYVQLAADNLTGTFTSATLDENESTATYYEVTTNISDADNSSVSFVAGGTTYELEDGVNEVQLDSGVTTFDLEFSRDDATITSPQVDTVDASTQKDDTLSLVMYMAAALFLILALAAPFTNLQGTFSGGRTGRRPPE